MMPDHSVCFSPECVDGRVREQPIGAALQHATRRAYRFARESYELCGVIADYYEPALKAREWLMVAELQVLAAELHLAVRIRLGIED